jgi:hypothetical protein
MFVILLEKINQSLVVSMVIGTELGRGDHSSIPATAIGRGLEPLDVRTDPRTRLNWWCKQKKLNIYFLCHFVFIN